MSRKIPGGRCGLIDDNEELERLRLSNDLNNNSSSAEASSNGHPEDLNCSENVHNKRKNKKKWVQFPLAGLQSSNAKQPQSSNRQQNYHLNSSRSSDTFFNAWKGKKGSDLFTKKAIEIENFNEIDSVKSGEQTEPVNVVVCATPVEESSELNEDEELVAKVLQESVRTAKFEEEERKIRNKLLGDEDEESDLKNDVKKEYYSSDTRKILQGRSASNENKGMPEKGDVIVKQKTFNSVPLHQDTRLLSKPRTDDRMFPVDNRSGKFDDSKNRNGNKSQIDERNDNSRNGVKVPKSNNYRDKYPGNSNGRFNGTFRKNTYNENNPKDKSNRYPKINNGNNVDLKKVPEVADPYSAGNHLRGGSFESESRHVQFQDSKKVVLKNNTQSTCSVIAKDKFNKSDVDSYNTSQRISNTNVCDGSNVLTGKKTQLSLNGDVASTTESLSCPNESRVDMIVCRSSNDDNAVNSVAGQTIVSEKEHNKKIKSSSSEPIVPTQPMVQKPLKMGLPQNRNMSSVWGDPVPDQFSDADENVSPVPFKCDSPELSHNLSKSESVNSMVDPTVNCKIPVNRNGNVPQLPSFKSNLRKEDTFVKNDDIPKGKQSDSAFENNVEVKFREIVSDIIKTKEKELVDVVVKKLLLMLDKSNTDEQLSSVSSFVDGSVNLQLLCDTILSFSLAEIASRLFPPDNLATQKNVQSDQEQSIQTLNQKQSTNLENKLDEDEMRRFLRHMYVNCRDLMKKPEISGEALIEHNTVNGVQLKTEQSDLLSVPQPSNVMPQQSHVQVGPGFPIQHRPILNVPPPGIIPSGFSLADQQYARFIPPLLQPSSDATVSHQKPALLPQSHLPSESQAEKLQFLPQATQLTNVRGHLGPILHVQQQMPSQQLNFVQRSEQSQFMPQYKMESNQTIQQGQSIQQPQLSGKPCPSDPQMVQPVSSVHFPQQLSLILGQQSSYNVPLDVQIPNMCSNQWVQRDGQQCLLPGQIYSEATSRIIPNYNQRFGHQSVNCSDQHQHELSINHSVNNQSNRVTDNNGNVMSNDVLQNEDNASFSSYINEQIKREPEYIQGNINNCNQMEFVNKSVEQNSRNLPESSSTDSALQRNCTDESNLVFYNTNENPLQMHQVQHLENTQQIQMINRSENNRNDNAMIVANSAVGSNGHANNELQFGGAMYSATTELPGVSVLRHMLPNQPAVDDYSRQMHVQMVNYYQQRQQQLLDHYPQANVTPNHSMSRGRGRFIS